MPHESLKHLGLLSIVVACAAGLYIVRRWPQGRMTSISRHAASHNTGYLIFASTITVMGALFQVFLWGWLGPTLKVSSIFYAVLVLAGLGQLLTAWAPDRIEGSRSSRIHRLAAFSVAFLMMPMSLLIALSANISPGALVIACGFLSLTAVLWYMFLFVKSSHNHFLLYQSSYLVGFYIVILSATYIR